MIQNPRQIIADGPMRRYQILVVALCVLLNALDGFDVLAISFAAPGIASEWGIDRAALGLVLSMELIGMAIGSIWLGNIADRFGRRPTILGCLMVMTVGMALVPLAGDVATLSAVRLGTGLGIGGMLACTNAMVAEFSNARNRAMAVMIMAAGYPFGAVVGGTFASHLLAIGDWRDVFLFGAIATGVFLPVVWFLLPESVSYLAHKGGPNAVRRINATLARMGHRTIDALPPREPTAPRTGLAHLLSPALARTTALLTVAFFMHIMTFYFILKWIPKLVSDMGHAASAAGGVLVWANVGGLLGALVLSLLTWRANARTLVVSALLLSTITVALFGQVQQGIGQISMIAALVGFCTNAGVVGLYAVAAQAFPTAVRAGGTGFVIGVGRGGAALGPIVAGFLFAGGFGFGLVASIMALGSLTGAVALAMLRMRDAPAE